MDIDQKKKIVDSWFSYLQSQICVQFESLENNISKNSNKFNLHNFTKSLYQFKKVRIIGSASLSLIYLAKDMK